MSLLDQLNWRYATKIFDTQKKIPQDQLDQLLETLRLSPSSYGLQPWKFVLVKNPEIRAKLREAAWGQAQVTDASHFLVFCSMTNVSSETVEHYAKEIAETRGTPLVELEGFKNMMLDFVKGKTPEFLSTWAGKQVYITLGTLLTSAAVMQIDACPMEGFDNAKFDEILGLKEKNLHAEVVCALGYRSPEDKYASAKKVRESKAEKFIEV
ncbi:MAG: NAD(P)H-dependent oxidoreductase [Patescibacteria group bacterium]